MDIEEENFGNKEIEEFNSDSNQDDEISPAKISKSLEKYRRPS